MIDSDGEFRMRTTNHDGAPLGEHVVTVHCRRPPTAAETQNLVIPELLIPERYTRADDTPLHFEVKDERNVYRLILE